MSENDWITANYWHEYKVGDEVEYWGYNHQGERTKGKVIAIVDLPGYTFPHYVIETETGMDPILSIRSGCILEMRLSK